MSLKEKEEKIAELEKKLAVIKNDREIDSSKIEETINDYKKETYSHLCAYDRVYLARKPERSHIHEFIDHVFDEFVEMRGDRYFKDAPKLPENHGQDVVFDKEKMKEIINKKVNQLEGHVNNLNTLKKELEGESAMVLNNTFPKDKEEYTKTTVNQMLKDYEEERKRIDDLEKKLDEIKK